MMKQIEVVAAIIHDEQNRVFATQRGYGEWKDFWEFPGGKMEPGVTSNFESTFFGKGKSTDFCRGFLRSYTRP
jgi:hypothetical protein